MCVNWFTRISIREVKIVENTRGEERLLIVCLHLDMMES